MNYNNNYDSVFSGLLGTISTIAVIIGIMVLVWVVVTIVALWKVYKKAGKNGWECIVPFYSYYVLVEIAGLNWWWFLLAISDNLISILNLDDLSTVATLVGLFARFNIYYNIAKKFNKNNGTAVCAGIFSGIFILIFGFSKDAVYDMNITVSKNGVIGTPDMNNNTYNSQNMNVYSMPSSSINNTNVDIGNQENNINSNEKNFCFCGNCGTRLNENVRFCPNCGKENK